MKLFGSGALALLMLALSACTTQQQQAHTDFKPPEGNYKLIVMRPDIQVSLLTAGGELEPREDWTEAARAHVLASLQAVQAKRGGQAHIAATREEAGGDIAVVTEMDRLHEAVGRSILLHKYTNGQHLPTKQDSFDWTLGASAVEFGRSTGYDYALFLFAADSFSSGGRMALMAMGALGCVVGVCMVPNGGQQQAFASLVDLKSGEIVWFNYVASTVGDIRTEAGADHLVAMLLDRMKPGQVKSDGR